MYGGKTKLKKWKPKVIHLALPKKWMPKIRYLCSIHRARRANLKVSYTLPAVIWFIPDTPFRMYSNISLEKSISVQPISVGLPGTATSYMVHYHKVRLP